MASYNTARSELLAAVEKEMEELPYQGAFPVRFTANLHDENLMSLPLDWVDATKRLDSCSVLDIGELPVDLTFKQWAVEAALTLAEPSLDPVRIDDARRKLDSFASPLITAEASGTQKFLDAGFLKKLVQAHRSRLPVVVAVSDVWIMDALSTRQGEVQARDLVRLLAKAAGLSIHQGWDDRLLAPQAVRDALESVGRSKIEEINEEHPELGKALEQFRALATKVRVPFRRRRERVLR